MAIRQDLTDFPFETTGSFLWYLVQTVEDDKIKTVYFTAAKSSKFEMLDYIDSLNSSINILGVWNGRYKTDLFEIPVDRLRLEFAKIHEATQ